MPTAHMSARFSFMTVSILLATMLPMVASGQDEPQLAIAELERDTSVNFEQEILPILRANCIACHNKTDAESGLVLESPAEMLEGGSEGPAVVPGQSAQSLLLNVAAHQVEPFMPPEDNESGAKNLTSEELGLIKIWIDQGAKGEVTGSSSPIIWQPLPNVVNPIYAVAVSRYGEYVAAGRGNRIFVYHIPTKSRVGQLTDPRLEGHPAAQGVGMAHLDLVQSLAFSPDGQLLASGGYRTAKIWRRITRVRQATLLTQAGEVTATAQSPAGRHVAIGLQDGKILLIDPASNEPFSPITAHQAPVRGLAFSTDGTRLVSGSDDESFQVRKVDALLEPTVVNIKAVVRAVAFVEGDTRIATGGEDGTVRIWEIVSPDGESQKPAEGEQSPEAGEDPQPVRQWDGHEGPIHTLTIRQAGGTELFSGGQDGKVRLWQIAESKKVLELDHGSPVATVAVRADGQRVASAGGPIVKLWQTNDGGKLVTELRGDRAAQRRVEDTNRGIDLAKRHVGNAKSDLENANKRKKSEDENLKKSEEQKNKAAEELTKKTEAAKQPVADKEAAQKELDAVKAEVATAEKVKGESEKLATQGEEALKAAQAAQEAAGKGDDEEAKKKAAETLAKAEADNKASAEKKQQAEKAFQEMTDKVKPAEEKLKKLTEAADKAVGERDGAQRSLNNATQNFDRAKVAAERVATIVPVAEQSVQKEEEQLKEQETKLEADKKHQVELEMPILAVAFSPDGSQLATAGEHQVVQTWNAESGEAVGVYSGQIAPVVAVSYTADGGLLSLARNTFVLTWDVQPGWSLQQTIGSTESPGKLVDRVTSLHFSPQGDLLATGSGEPSRSGQVKIWRTDTAQLVCAMDDAHSDSVLGLEFSPDASYIASCGADRFMKVFQTTTGTFVRSFEGHTHYVLGVSWRADGREIATCGADKVIKVWDFRTGEQRKTIGGFSKEVTSVQYVGVGNHVVVSAGDNKVETKDSTGKDSKGFSGAGDFVYCARSSVDGKTIVAGGQDSVVRIWNADGKSIVNFEPPPVETSSTEPQATDQASK